VSGPDGVRDLTCDQVREMAGAFVLGALDAADEDAVREHLVTCPEAHEEIAELAGVVPALAASVPVVEPPDALKGRIMAAAAADQAERSAAPVELTPFPGATERQARKRQTSAGTWLLRIAAVLAIVALGGWNLLLQGQLNAAKTYEQAVADVLTVAGQPGSLTAVLTADGGTGSGMAAISASGQVTIAMQDLAPTSGNTVYEAWAIVGGAPPMPLGSFTVGSGGTATFDATGLPDAGAVVLALTLEPAPGATTPTMPIIAKGVATPAG
jgi:anti-sigma-K factor RskA